MSISESTVGRYLCRASARGFTEVTAEASVLMKGPPRIIRRQQTQYGAVGETVRIACDAFAIPPPKTIVWSQHGFTFPTAVEGGHYAKEEESRPDGIKSTLVIRDAVEADFDVGYNCTVRNSHGEDSFVVTLEKESEGEEKSGESWAGPGLKSLTMSLLQRCSLWW